MSVIEKLYPWVSVTLISMLPGVINLLLLRWANPTWWRIRILRRLAWWLPVIGAVQILIWLVGMRFASPDVDRLLATLYLLVYLPQLALVFALALTGFIHFVEKRLDRRHRIDPGRRKFLRGATAAMPILAGGGCLSATIEASLPAKVYRRPVVIPNLPAALDGYRILHISDLHLAGFVTMNDLDGILDRARPFEPDLIAITGDIVDNLRMLPEALEKMVSFGAPDGAIAVLGNHEYGNGIRTVMKNFESSPVLLLLDQGQRVPVGDASLFFGGIDDIRHYEDEPEDPYYTKAVAAAFADSRDDDIRILLTHRPDAFDQACAQGIDLTLAGHTHGGQIVLFGRSVFPRRSGERYARGLETRGKSTIYTSRGCGHWFPLRLGCSTEAPIIELVRS